MSNTRHASFSAGKKSYRQLLISSRSAHHSAFAKARAASILISPGAPATFPFPAAQNTIPSIKRSRIATKTAFLTTRTQMPTMTGAQNNTKLSH